MMMFIQAAVLCLALSAFPVCSQQSGDLSTPCTWCSQNGACSGENQTCVCPPHFVGRGDFLCYKEDDWDVCTLCDDPILLGYGGPPTVKLNFLDTFLFSDDIFQGKGSASGSTLRLRTFISGYRSKGKVYPQCILVMFEMTSRRGGACRFVFKVWGRWISDTEALEFDIREGIESNGKLEFTADNRIAFLNTAVGSTKTHVMNNVCGCGIKLQIEKGNIFVAEFLNCINYDIGFRPFISDYPWVKSGVYVRGQKRTPSDTLPFATENLPVCLLPGLHLDQLRDYLSLNQTTDAAAFIAMVNLRSPVVRETFPAQINLTTALFTCTPGGLYTFFSNARTLLSLHPVMKCICGAGESVQHYIDMLTDAVGAVCNVDITACHKVRDLLNSRCGSVLTAHSRNPAYLQIFNKWINCS